MGVSNTVYITRKIVSMTKNPINSMPIKVIFGALKINFSTLSMFLCLVQRYTF